MIMKTAFPKRGAEKIDLLKLDIERSEEAFLTAGEQWLKM